MDSRKVAETLGDSASDDLKNKSSVDEAVKYTDKWYEAEVEKVRRKFGIDELTRQQRLEISNNVLQASIEDLYRSMENEENND